MSHRDYEQWDGEVYTGNYEFDIKQSFSRPLFTKDILPNPIFKWEDLAGKELLIKVGTSPDELGKGEYICVIGVDKTTGKCYVLHTGFKGAWE